MFRGVVVVSFDYKLGPIVEATFPEGVVPKESLWDLAVDVWMSIFSGEITEDSNQKIYGNLGRLAFISFCENSENYAVIALFDESDGGTVWQFKDTLKEVIGRAVENLRKGTRSTDVARTVYEEINGIIAGPRKLPIEVYNDVTRMYDALGNILKLVNEVKESDVKNKLITAVAELSDRIADLVLNLASLWGDREIINSLIRKAEGAELKGVR
ncbi:MAG: hypothetical protein QXX87_04090 [Candidatus Jordarchaeales archaeon]